MTTRTAAVIEHHLRTLGQTALRDFVADLWGARGYETRIEESVVIATRADESTVLYPVVSGRFDTGGPPDPDRPIDAIVAPRAGRQDRRLADRTDAELIDAKALREMLWYAIGRPARWQLCERHLGDIPEQLRPPVRTRIRRQAVALGSSTAIVSIVGLVLVGAIIGGVVGVGQSPSPEPPGTPVATDTPEVDPVDTATETPGTDATLWNVPVPGVTKDGITNISALVRAHERSVANRSYTLWLDRYQPRGGQFNASRVQHDIDIRVEDGRYRLDLSIEDMNSGIRHAVRTVYYDGTAWYVANTTGNNATYRRTTSLGSSEALAYNPLFLERSLVLTYLATQRSTVAGRVVDGDRTLYRIVGHGPPSEFTDVWGYTVVATVDRRGFVRSIRATYTKITDTGTYEVRFTATYDRLDETTVEPPAWYDQRFGNRTDGTSSTVVIEDRPIDRLAFDRSTFDRPIIGRGVDG